jgi:hypothetical protein
MDWESVMSRVALLGLIFLCSAVGAQEVLPDVVVTASTTDFQDVSIPGFMGAGMGVHGVNSQYMQIDDDNVVDMTKAQVCAYLSSNKPSNCSATSSSWDASPHIDSSSGAAWAPNGCGPGGWANTWLSAAEAISSYISGRSFSGDLNKPDSGHGDVDFTDACNNHDRCYATGSSQASCDSNFYNAMTSVCNSSTDQAGCDGFRDDYNDVVTNTGAGPFADGHSESQCTAWAYSMNQDNC